MESAFSVCECVCVRMQVCIGTVYSERYMSIYISLFLSLTLNVCACVYMWFVYVFVCKFLCVFLGSWARLCVCPCVQTVVHACCAVMPACHAQLHIQHFALFFFFSSPLIAPLPLSIHFGVLLDRTTHAAGNSPLSTLHPKACGFWKLVCVWVGLLCLWQW